MPTIMVENRVGIEVFDDTIGSQTRLHKLSQKSRRLKGRGKKLPKGFQLEPLNPSLVGLAEEASDAFTPEELVGLFAHPRKTVDWDRLEEVNNINYFWEGDE